MVSSAAQLGLLDRPDGSASYSYNGFAVTAAVTGPIEVQRRDELPDEAAIDVIVRPASGIGAIRERYHESLIHDVLRMAVQTKAHPRTLIQMTLQITSTPTTSHSRTGRLPAAALNLMIVPCLLNAALLALMTTTIPMQLTYSAAGLVVDNEDNLLLEPTPAEIDAAVSMHIFCFATSGTSLLQLSEGPIRIDHLETIELQARSACLGAEQNGRGTDDVQMDGNVADHSGHIGFLKQTILDRLKKHDSWRNK